MLLIALAIVPFWKTLEPIEFARWFRQHSFLLGRIMLPLGASATVLAVVAASLLRPVGSPPFRWFALATAFAVAVAAICPIYFTSANAILVDGNLEASEIAVELQRWSAWHWVRTAAGLLGFLAALRGLLLYNG